MRAKPIAVVAGLAIALTASSPAIAAPWDGNIFDFGLGTQWRLGSNFEIGDVDLGSTAVGFTQPASTSGVYTDIWDTGLDMNVVSTVAGISADYDCTGTAADIDISTSGDDLVIACQVDWDEPTNAAVNVRGEIRIYGPDGDLFRYTLAIQNSSNADISDFTVRTFTDWGSDGDIWDYQNFDTGVLALPALADDGNAAKLRSVDSNWVVNYTGGNAPGSLAWGNNNGTVDVGLSDTVGDYFSTETDTFTVAAGETVYLVYFTGWDPANLISLSFDRSWVGDNGDLASSAVADAATEFDSFSGRLTRGLPADANVLNWTPATEAEGLATTGADNVSIWAGLGLLVAGVAGRAIRRRVRA